jgi:hypothetical protein
MGTFHEPGRIAAERDRPPTGNARFKVSIDAREQIAQDTHFRAHHLGLAIIR